jgi:flagellar hook assembly protein FlgD
MVGNATEIVEEWYTVSSAGCVDPAQVGVGVEVNQNPFDPFAGEVVVFSLNGFRSGGGKVEATVYDLTGERVATIDASAGSVVWDGKTYRGEVVAEGVYLIHFQRVGGAAGYGATSQAIKVVVKRAD